MMGDYFLFEFFEESGFFDNDLRFEGLDFGLVIEFLLVFI